MLLCFYSNNSWPRLEDQLLAEVVRAECPDLESSKSDLTEMQNSFKIRLQRLEIDLLDQLTAAGGSQLKT